MVRTHIVRLLVAVLAIGLVGVPSLHADAQSTAAPAETHDEAMNYDGRDRGYRVHVPPFPAPAGGMPALIVLHGGGGNGRQIEGKTGFSELADREGFVAVYPDGTGRNAKRLTWDAHNCCAYAYDQQVDDVGFISALIDRLIAEYDVDPDRIYITGHSNGAMMTFRLACELSDKIAAAAPYAGALNTDTCTPSSPVPILIMNGAADANVPVAGGLSPNAGVASENGRVDNPTSYAVQTWVANDGCAPAPVVDETTTATVSTYRNCSNGAMVEQMLIHDWTHKWPSEANGASLDGAEVIWSFVSQFSKSAA